MGARWWEAAAEPACPRGHAGSAAASVWPGRLACRRECFVGCTHALLVSLHGEWAGGYKAGRLIINPIPPLLQSKLDSLFAAGGPGGKATFIRGITFSRGPAVSDERWCLACLTSYHQCLRKRVHEKCQTRGCRCGRLSCCRQCRRCCCLTYEMSSGASTRQQMVPRLPCLCCRSRFRPC